MAGEDNGDGGSREQGHEGDDPRADESADTPSPSLSRQEIDSVAEKQAGNSRVVHEVVRLQGEEELKRPFLSLLLSAFAAGITMSASILAEAFLAQRLPDTPASELIVDLGYSFGFVVVILGNLQLFTETTVTAVLPLATHPSGRNLTRLLRLWSVVIVGNLLGTLAATALIASGAITSPEALAAAVKVSTKLQDHDFWTTLLFAIPSGFLIGSIAWLLPNARANAFWVIVAVTYVIAIGGFSHVVAGSSEAWLVWLSGHASFGWALGGFIVPALIGNILGGTGLFAVLAHGQVRGEL